MADFLPSLPDLPGITRPVASPDSSSGSSFRAMFDLGGFTGGSGGFVATPPAIGGGAGPGATGGGGLDTWGKIKSGVGGALDTAGKAMDSVGSVSGGSASGLDSLLQSALGARVALFLIGLICIIGAIYLYKPTQNIVTEPLRAAGNSIAAAAAA